MADTVQVEGNLTGAEAPVEEQQGAERPEWLPEKFNSPEDLAKAYGELEKNFTKSRQEDAEPVEEEQPQEADDAREAVENVGLDFDSMSQEFMEAGELSEQTYSDLEARGIPKEVVDGYIQGQMALAQNVQGQIYNSVGGEDNYQEMVEWASDNMSDTEIDAYNSAVNSGSLDQARLAVEGLSARYRAVNGTEPNLVGGKASSSVDTYQSWAQVTADMSRPEYQKDPAFRESVQQKIGRSNIS